MLIIKHDANISINTYIILIIYLLFSTYFHINLYTLVNKDLKNIIGDIKFNDGLTQTEIAQKIGVSSTYLSDMVNERVPITSSILGKIYELFPYTKKLPDDEIEEIKAKFEEMKKRVEELEYTIELQKRLLDQK